MWTFIRPSSWAFAITSAGWIEPSSYSRSFGRISRSAKSCARSRNAFCSSVRPNETPPAVTCSMVAIFRLQSSLIDWSVKRRAEPQDTGHVNVQLAPTGKWNEDANGTRSIGAAGEKKEIRAGPSGRDGPLLRVTADDIERVGYRDALEPEVAQQSVRGRLERRAAWAECRVDAVADHHARYARLDCRTVRSEVRFAAATENVGPVVGGERERSQTRKVLGAGAGSAGGEPTSKSDTEKRRTKLPRAERPIRQVEDGPERDIHVDPPQATSRRYAGLERLRLAPDSSRGRARRQLRERLHAPALLIGDHKRTDRPRRVPVVLLHDHAGHARRSR